MIAIASKGGKVKYSWRQSSYKLEYISEELGFGPTGGDLSFILRKIPHFSLIDKQEKKTEYAVKIFPIACEVSKEHKYEILLRNKDRKILQDTINGCCIGSIVNNIPNRQAGEEIIATISEFVKGHTIDIVAGIMSVDKSNHIRQQHGEQSIDEIDSIIGSRFDDCCRMEDLLFQLDSGVYIVLLFDCTEGNGGIVFNRLRMAIENKPFELTRGVQIPVTVSSSYSCISKEVAGYGHAILEKLEARHTHSVNQVHQVDLVH